VAGAAQAEMGGAIHQPWVAVRSSHVELMFDAGCLPVKPGT
jgi:hypothetical protein